MNAWISAACFVAKRAASTRLMTVPVLYLDLGFSANLADLAIRLF